MINLRNSPFLWFALLLLLAFNIHRFAAPFIRPQDILILTAIAVIAAGTSLIKYTPGRQIWSTMAIGIVICTCGLVRVNLFETAIMPGASIDDLVRMQGVVEVTEVLKEKKNSLSLRCIASELITTDQKANLAYTDKFLVVQIKEPALPKIFPGDKLSVSGWVSSIKGPLNPHAFDIRTYYKSIGIRHQLFAKGKEVSKLETSKKSLFRSTAQWQFILCSIVRNHTSEEVAQLTNALVWGDRTYMDEEIRDAFANSGAMHVLSVSGMHMAIIYSMLYLILGAPGSGSFTRRITRFMIYAVSIMIYMGLTGACPAVVRSGLMILLFLLGKAMGWNTQIWNLLGFAGFLMLWINPFVMYNIGFQLSFLAMAGILLYAKPIIRYFSFKSILAHLVWEVTAVSVAAQVFIFPLLLYHFYQFPLTFVASSLVAMPASYIIIFGSLLNICFSFLHWQWLWDIYDVACHYFIQVMKWMASLNPDMNYSLPSLANGLLTVMAILFSIALVYRWPKGKKLAYLAGIVAFINLAWHRHAQWNTKELTVYHQYQGLLIDIIIDGRCTAISDSIVTPRSIDFAARGNRCFKDVIHTRSVRLTENITSPFWQYYPPLVTMPPKNIMIWNDERYLNYPPIQLTHLVVNKCSEIKSLKYFLCQHPGIIVILPAHLERKGKNALVRFLKENEISYHDISEVGFITIAL